MNGDNNNEDKKEKKNHHEDGNSQKTIKKQDETNLMESKANSEELEILEDLSPKMRQRVKAFMSMGSISGSALSPFESKINEKHIDRILDIKEKYDDNIFRDTQSSRKFQLIVILVGVSLFAFLTIFLVGKHSNILEDIIKFVIGLFGGIGIGYGFKAHKDKD